MHGEVIMGSAFGVNLEDFGPYDAKFPIEV